jgi:outer membrane protein assembly factor BamB
MPMSRILLFSSLALSWTVALATGADWARFRGPNGSGTVEGTLPEIDPKKPLWKVVIPGQGAGSPIVIGDKIFLQTASKDGKTRTLLCLNAADGSKIWSEDLPGTSATIHVKNSFASSTPASNGEAVYCAWWDGSGVGLHAYDMKGKEKWRTSLGGYVSQHGPGMSPVLHEGLVFVNVDDDQRAELVAFDAKTGDKKWQMPRKSYRASYSSPFILKRGDKPAELILGTTTAITSYEPATGKINWNYELSWPAGKMPLRVIGHPVYAGGLIVMSCGDGGGSRYMVAINPDEKNPAMVWELNKETPYVPCMLVKGDLLFWVTDKPGLGCCAEAKTGKVLWSERLFGKEVTSSPIMVGDDIMAIGEDGEVIVFKASKEFETVAKVSLKEAVYASPAVANGKVYIRGAPHLFCFGSKP